MSPSLKFAQALNEDYRHELTLLTERMDDPAHGGHGMLYLGDQKPKTTVFAALRLANRLLSLLSETTLRVVVEGGKEGNRFEVAGD